MVELNSPVWARLTHAYGSAHDVPKLLEQLNCAACKEWDTIYDQLMSAIAHQGDGCTAMYAAAPHLVRIACEIGPCAQSDDILQAIAYASRGVGPEVPELIEEGWEDALSETRDLILERLLDSQVSEQHAGALIGGLLYLSGETPAGELITNWCWGQAFDSTCPHCSCLTRIFWHGGHVYCRTKSPDGAQADESQRIKVTPTTTTGIKADHNLEFEPEFLDAQILGLALASGHVSIQRQLRNLFGTRRCHTCEADLRLAHTRSPEDDELA